jgi:hypothetical protein
MFCDVCIDALQHRKGHLEITGTAVLGFHCDLAHHQSITSLISSAEQTCEICYPFWHRLNGEECQRLIESDVSFQRGSHPHGPSVYSPDQTLADLNSCVTLVRLDYWSRDARTLDDQMPDGFINLNWTDAFKDTVRHGAWECTRRILGSNSECIFWLNLHQDAETTTPDSRSVDILAYVKFSG